MPYVNIKVTGKPVTKEQKMELIKGVTTLLEQVLQKHPSTTYVVIEEIPTDNWGAQGQQVTELLKTSNP
jgi:4-oxalocrotonate tautomerase